MKAAVIQHPRMDKDILVQTISGDKAVSTQVIEEFHHRTHFALLGLGGGRRGRVQRALHRQQILDHAAMFIEAQRHRHHIAGEKTHKAEPVQRRAMKKDLFITDPHEPVSFAFIVPDQTALADLYFACRVLCCMLCCILCHLHYPMAPVTRHLIIDINLPVRNLPVRNLPDIIPPVRNLPVRNLPDIIPPVRNLSATAATPHWSSHNGGMMKLVKPRTKGQKR